MSNSAQIKIIVASHKPYWMPKDPMYIPIQVGASGKEKIDGFQPDNQGENISTLNPFYSELTALYWAWKNVDADYVGLVHYRRHFKGQGEKKVVTSDDIFQDLKKFPVILPKKRSYWIETVESHYAHTFSQEHIDLLREAIVEVSPDFISYFDKHMSQTKTHVWNMVVMRRDILNSWCEWLFSVLDIVEYKIDFNGMSTFEQRVIGRLSEFLIDPWLEWQGVEYAERPVVSLEGEPWLKKGKAFLAAKFFGKKYQESF